jgi:hypothetical protein
MKVEQIKREFSEYQQKKSFTATDEQKEKILALAKDLPHLWVSPATKDKDRKRILRLLIKDITVEKLSELGQVILHVRWQGGACEDIKLDLPQKIYDKWRYPERIVETVRKFAATLTDAQIAERLNKEGLLSAKGKSFTKSMVNWIRYKHAIPSLQSNGRRPEEFTVKQISEKLEISQHVIYYWISQGLLNVRKIRNGAPYWIALDSKKEKELRQKIMQSTKIQNIKKHNDLTRNEPGGI